MKKFLLVILLALSICAFSVNVVFAASSRLVDDAKLLTASEKSELLSLLNEISERQDMDVVIVTVKSLGDKSPRAYADDYYDYHGYDADGILLLVAMDSRDYYISTSGDGITALNDAEIDYISGRFAGDLSRGNYASAFRTYAELCDDYISEAKSGNDYDRGNSFPFGKNLLVSLAIGFVIAFIATAIMRSKLKSVRSKSNAADYVRQGSFRVTNSKDLFLYRRVTRRARPKDNGSSTHRSSSGRSHGGGGGKF